MFEGKRFTGEEFRHRYNELVRAFPALSVIVLLTMTSASCASAVLPPNPTRTPKPTFTTETIGLEVTADGRLEIKTPVVLPTATPLATSTEIPVPTPASTAALTPTIEATNTPKPPETATRVVVRTSKPTQTSAVEATPIPEFPFHLVGEPEFAPNCGTVYLEGEVLDKDGNPLNGQIVELDFWGNRSYRETGKGKMTGQFGFAPLSGDQKRLPQPFKLRLVTGEDNPEPLSDTYAFDFTDCDVWGQVSKIKFQKN